MLPLTQLCRLPQRVVVLLCGLVALGGGLISFKAAWDGRLNYQQVQQLGQEADAVAPGRPTKGSWHTPPRLFVRFWAAGRTYETYLPLANEELPRPSASRGGTPTLRVRYLPANPHIAFLAGEPSPYYILLTTGIIVALVGVWLLGYGWRMRDD